MRSEEHLDRLGKPQETGKNQAFFSSDETRTLQAAGEKIAPLQQIPVPPAFTHRLEQAVRARARLLAPAQPVDRPLLLVHSQKSSLSTHAPIPLARVQDHRSLRRRARGAVMGLVAILLITLTSLLTISSHSLPGDPLYGLNQAAKRFTLTFASDQHNRSTEAIGQLRSALADLSMVVNERRNDNAIQQALAAVVTWTDSSQEAVSTLKGGPDLQATQQDLHVVLTQEDQTLRHSLRHVDWSLQVAFTHQLGVLGGPVPVVTHVVTTPQGNGTLQVTLLGTGFAQHTAFMVDGKATGTISQNTGKMLVVVIETSEWSSGTYTIGLRNPDGTAAATHMVFHQMDDEQG